jgi:hypothetical protein
MLVPPLQKSGCGVLGLGPPDGSETSNRSPDRTFPVIASVEKQYFVLGIRDCFVVALLAMTNSKPLKTIEKPGAPGGRIVPIPEDLIAYPGNKLLRDRL